MNIEKKNVFQRYVECKYANIHNEKFSQILIYFNKKREIRNFVMKIKNLM